jgi:molybdate transport system substrate-binding protein
MRRIVLAFLLLLPFAAQGQSGAAPATVFAAASLTDALGAAADAYAKGGHPAPRLSFNASSALARQVEQGAPASIFFSADERWMDWLQQRNLIVPETRRSLLRNTLVLIVPKSQARTVTVGPGLDVGAMLGADGRIATGDPKSVPVGIYAEQALRKLGLWDKVSPRLAPAENVRAALLLVERGEAAAGIVYATDAAASKGVAVAGTFPESSHDPITYPVALVRDGDTPEARSLLGFLEGPEAREVFDRFGFGTE